MEKAKLALAKDVQQSAANSFVASSNEAEAAKKIILDSQKVIEGLTGVKTPPAGSTSTPPKGSGSTPLEKGGINPFTIGLGAVGVLVLVMALRKKAA